MTTEPNPTPPMTPERLAEIEALAEKATPGPWQFVLAALAGEYAIRDAAKNIVLYLHGERHADARLICHARADIPALCAALREAWSDRDGAIEECHRLMEIIGQCQWHDIALQERAAEQAHRAVQAESERDALRAHADDLAEKSHAFRAERDDLRRERDALRAEVERLRADVTTWRGRSIDSDRRERGLAPCPIRRDGGAMTCVRSHGHTGPHTGLTCGDWA